jgi:hypothetical protein
LPNPSSLNKKKPDNSKSYIVEEFARYTKHNQVNITAGAVEKPTRAKLKKTTSRNLTSKKNNNIDNF